MKLRGILLALCLPSAAAHAGGLLLPGAGAVSTARAGAGTASADDGEALVLNPAGLAKAKGTTISISAAAFDYFMQFTRAGTYDQTTGADEDRVSYAGQPFGTVKNQPKPPLGIGAVQPVPVIAIISDLGGVVPGLHVAAGVFAPNAYPFRDMTNGYVFNQAGDEVAPPPTRYDILKQEAAILMPSIAVAYHVNKTLDIGARFSFGVASLKSTTGLWGMPQNYDEWVKKDGVFTIDAKDNFVPVFDLGVLYRPTDNLEFGANFQSETSIQAKGTAISENGSHVSLNGQPITIHPPDDSLARCAPGGTIAELKACVGLSLPMNAQIGGRYKFLDANGHEQGDIEIDGDWEHWGKTCSRNASTGALDDLGCTSPSDYRVTVDGVVFTNGIDSLLSLKDSVVGHGLQDTWAVRVGGSYHIPLDDKNENEVIVRGGVGYDTQAAKDGWLRSDLDGAARTTVSVGGSYKTRSWKVDAGFGVILEGSPTNANLLSGNVVCNPTGATGSVGCSDNGATQTPPARSQGPGSDQPARERGPPGREPGQPGRVQVALPDVHARLLDLVLARRAGSSLSGCSALRACGRYLITIQQ